MTGASSERASTQVLVDAATGAPGPIGRGSIGPAPVGPVPVGPAPVGPDEIGPEVTGPGVAEEAARAEARRLWSALAAARCDEIPAATAAAEDALFAFYLPLATALADAAISRTVTARAAQHAAEVGLAQAVLSWPGSDQGFLRFASRSIADVLRHLPTATPGRRHPLLSLDLAPLTAVDSAPTADKRASGGAGAPSC